jgi:triacylglycerol esterase/lipase EstA (alpha/beta hydrolase family)
MRTFINTFAILLATLSVSAPLAAARPSDLAARDPLWDAILSLNVIGNPGNDFKCKSTAHSNPVILIHALSANPSIDLNLIQRDMQDQGYCTYATTYGAHTLAPWIGGLKDMRESSQTLAGFILEVVQKTGAPKVDLVGHSEGGVMSLYVPMKYPQVSAHVDHIVALGPAVHGAQYFGLTQLFYEGGQFSRDLAAKVSI